MKLKFTTKENGELETEKSELPNLCQKRSKHSSIIVRDVLFVFFGATPGGSQTVEYIDLLNPVEFKELQVINL